MVIFQNNLYILNGYNYRLCSEHNFSLDPNHSIKGIYYEYRDKRLIDYGKSLSVLYLFAINEYSFRILINRQTTNQDQSEVFRLNTDH